MGMKPLLAERRLAAGLRRQNCRTIPGGAPASSIAIRSPKAGHRPALLIFPPPALFPSTPYSSFASVRTLMPSDEILLEAEEKMIKTEEVVQREFASAKSHRCCDVT